MLVLIGKAASGKDTVKNELIKKHGFHSLITYTTREPRQGEIPNITYHYITKDDFLEKIKNGFFAEWKSYVVNDEIWYYGSAKEDFENADKSTVVILTPAGVNDIRESNIQATVIYLYSNINTIKKRLTKRNDKNDDAENRIKRDASLFKDADIIADKIVYNNIDTDINEVVKNVLEQYERMNK